MEIVVTPSSEVFNHENKKEKTELLAENIARKLEAKDMAVESSIHRGELLFELEENKIAGAVHHLENLPGVGSVSPCMRVRAEPEKIAEEFDEQDIEPREYQISTIPDDEKLVEEMIEVLGDEGWARTEEPDVDLTVRKIDIDGEEYYLVSLHTSKGIGGLPTEKENSVLVTFRDRADAYAAYRYILKGFRIHPLTVKKNTDSLKEGIRFLEEFIPETKPVVMKSDSWQEGVEKAVKLFKPEKVVTGRLKGEEKFLDPEKISVPLEEPLEDMEEDQVLQMYESIRPVII